MHQTRIQNLFSGPEKVPKTQGVTTDKWCLNAKYFPLKNIITQKLEQSREKVKNWLIKKISQTVWAQPPLVCDWLSFVFLEEEQLFAHFNQPRMAPLFPNQKRRNLTPWERQNKKADQMPFSTVWYHYIASPGAWAWACSTIISLTSPWPKQTGIGFIGLYESMNGENESWRNHVKWIDC